MIKPNYLFETSWEVCNKIGGIHTVIATKAPTILEQFNNHYITIGPDVWRETYDNPEFTQDDGLFKTWRLKAKNEGLRIRVGRWNILGNPIAILVDFSPFILKKNDILKKFWEDYQLDSISGDRDYIEAAMFGYSVAKVIESFCNFNLTVREKVVAHFHEWMTGAGVLYLKKNAPQISTVFTTHATTVGRSVAGNGMALYKNIDTFNGDVKAKELGVVSKHSMEKIAAQQADIFTTVSDITAKECSQFLEREIDTLTPNGFENNIVPAGDAFAERRKQARNKFFQVTEALLGYELKKDTVLTAISGRYEFRNKGIDVFVDALGKLNQQADLQKDILAFVLVPANNYGARKDLKQRLYAENNDLPVLDGKPFLTHLMHDADDDPTLKQIEKAGLTNSRDERVKIIFVPSYLHGNDGIFNMTYWDLLIGLDSTVFPSYYEPWGYTPLESLAFKVPTITSSLAGFGNWIEQQISDVENCIAVAPRSDDSYNETVDFITERLAACTTKTASDKAEIAKKSHEIAQTALWENLVKHYYQAYNLSLEKLEKRADKIMKPTQTQTITLKLYKSNKPLWKSVKVDANIPDSLRGLDELSKNLWWSWCYEAKELFAEIDKKLWKKNRYNPIPFLKELPYNRFLELEKNSAFMQRYLSVYQQFKDYMAEKPLPNREKIAYFSMEYGLHDSLKIFSGGLGILAGDYLKEASDGNYKLIAIGLLYHYGYFKQQLSLKGEQLVSYHIQNFADIPATQQLNQDGSIKTIQIAFPGRIVYASIWKVMVGRVALYLLDADIEQNTPEDRKLTHHLYGGNNEHRLMQEMLLGVGGMRVLDALEIRQEVYHCNEGHAAFIGLERLRKLQKIRSLTFNESLEIVRASTLFTTHTPVPAGHDSFSEDLIMTYMGHYPERLNISWEQFVNLGKQRPGAVEKFSMSHLACNIASEVNGVSMLHGEVTRQMFVKMWDGYFPDELHISHVTNGVHYPTWTAREWQKLYAETFGEGFFNDQSNENRWAKIYDVPDEKIWEIRQQKRAELVSYLKARLSSNWMQRHEDPRRIIAVRNKINQNTLTIGFARRFASYKRGNLLMRDINRLLKIVNRVEMPVQILFAGKAHPQDGMGHKLIQEIVEISKRPEFIGKIIFLENYDIELAKRLVQGVDIWLNTPTRPLEASGTSGMKAVMNGVMNFSVLDGWWVEGYREQAGWALPQEKTYENQEFQNELDAETIYKVLENEIVPLFYKRNEAGIPVDWIQYIKKCIAQIAPHFTTKRMIDDYQSRFYGKLATRYQNMRANDYEMAKEMASWKKRVSRAWQGIEAVSVDFPLTSGAYISGEKYTGLITLDLKELDYKQVGVELLVTDIIPANSLVNQDDSAVKIVSATELELVKHEHNLAYYRVEFTPPKPGLFNYGLRVFPKHKNLPHRQDFAYVKWI